MKTIKLKINKTNLLSRLGEAFTDNQTVFKELAQNANRSKATKLAITTTENSITFADNGTGIGDWQKLLTVAESGWDLETVEKTNAFGIGFLSAIYASERVEVHSNGSKIVFDTKDLLDGKSIDIEADELITDGTVIKLVGDFNLLDLGSLFIGFPIPVFINEAEIKRVDALNDEDFEKTDYGFIKVAGGKYSSRNSEYSEFYLQGQKVYSDKRYTYGKVNIIHLDETTFKARLPDRDKLINEAEVIKEVYDAIKATYAQQAIELVERLRDVDVENDMGFIKDSFSFVKEWNKPALNELNYVLGSDFINDESIDLVIGSCDVAEYNSWDYLDGIIFKSELEGKVIIKHESSYIDEEEMDAMTYASMSNDCYVLSYDYDESHWVSDMVSVHSGDCTLEVVAVNTHKTAYNPSNWVYIHNRNNKKYDTSFCKATELTLVSNKDSVSVEIGTMTNDKHSVYSHRMAEFFIVDEDNSAMVLLSAVGFYSEYSHEESEEDQELDAFSSFIRRNRINSDAEMLKEIISNEISKGIIPQELLGKTLTFKWDSELNVVDLKVA